MYLSQFCLPDKSTIGDRSHAPVGCQGWIVTGTDPTFLTVAEP